MPRVELVYWIMMDRLKFDAWYDDLKNYVVERSALAQAPAGSRTMRLSRSVRGLKQSPVSNR